MSGCVREHKERNRSAVEIVAIERELFFCFSSSSSSNNSSRVREPPPPPPAGTAAPPPQGRRRRLRLRPPRPRLPLRPPPPLAPVPWPQRPPPRQQKEPGDDVGEGTSIGARTRTRTATTLESPAWPPSSSARSTAASAGCAGSQWRTTRTSSSRPESECAI